MKEKMDAPYAVKPPAYRDRIRCSYNGEDEIIGRVEAIKWHRYMDLPRFSCPVILLPRPASKISLF